MSRWNSWSATSPLWGTGLALVVIGLVLIAAGVRAVHRG